jgi:hypothetical protein
VRLRCLHHCRRPAFHQAFHRCPLLLIRPHVRAVRPHPEQRLAVRLPEEQGLAVQPRAQAVRPLVEQGLAV